MNAAILIVEDNIELAWGLNLNLTAEGYEVVVTSTYTDALHVAQARPFSLILLDLMLPDGNGLDILATLRKRGSSIPVIVLSARTDEIDRVGAFRVGADDYVVKPFSLAELQERVRARLRTSMARAFTLAIDGLHLDFVRRVASRNQIPISLTDREWRLLVALAECAGVPLSRDQLLAHIWGNNSAVHRRNVDYFVSTLRSKVEIDPHHPTIIITKPGEGYLFQTAASS
jgi:DNA-binding response OmpR family regulator